MPEKKTSNMYIRAIPIDVWERIDKLCRRKNMKRRDFVEQALRFFEAEEPEPDIKQGESAQPPDIKRLKRDVENLKGEVKKNKDKPKAERKIDMTGRHKGVRIEQIKPDSAGKLILERPDPSGGISSLEEGIKKPLTTVYCWGLKGF